MQRRRKQRAYIPFNGSHSQFKVIHGRFNGSYHGHPNQAVFDDLVPGDIIFCHDAGGGYGYYTH
ncbi:hypothetical protein GCM10025859_30550 [Alicyclobacillus fastidiosus]|nr:hypothetical protein GCM10025859_30550 [Alicyclobacillus fastidiosus]